MGIFILCIVAFGIFLFLRATLRALLGFFKRRPVPPTVLVEVVADNSALDEAKSVWAENEKIKSKVPRIALTAFHANPLLAECEVKALFTEIIDLLKSGMAEVDIVKVVLENHATKPTGSSFH